MFKMIIAVILRIRMKKMVANYKVLIFWSICFVGLIFFTACVQKETAVRVGQVESLDRLNSLASGGTVRIQDPGNGFDRVVIGTNRNNFTGSGQGIFDYVVRGALSTSKEMWIRNFALNDFSLLYSSGNRFRVKRLARASLPQVVLTMSGRGTLSGVRAEVDPLSQSPYTIARISFSGNALPDFSLASAKKSFYVKAEYAADTGERGGMDAALYDVPLKRLLRLLFEMEYPGGGPGSMSGRVYLLLYKVKRAAAREIVFDCVYRVEVD